jgi:lipid II:glycine glycyltransferase (peptidoglycan interpeptide bridge formation enzyme)
MNKTTVRLAREDEIMQWDKLILENPDGGETMQTRTMAEIKKSQGWEPEYWVYETSFGAVYATVLTRHLFGMGRLCYMMRGPGVANAKQFAEIVKLNKIWEKFGFAIKMEPPITEVVKTNDDLVKVHNIQPNANTIVLNLSKPEDEILTNFRQRARREIRAAEKEGVTVKQVEITDETLNQMFELYKSTGERAGFFIRPKNYYMNFWCKFADADEGSLYFAYAPSEKQPLAGAFICHLGKKALYKDGGSRRSDHKHFAHFLQWEIMRNLKSRGISEYDLHGVPPQDRLDDKNHPLAGLAMFKISFSDNIIEYAGAYDQILNPKIYKRWIKFGQRLHQTTEHRLHKTTLY